MQSSHILLCRYHSHIAVVAQHKVTLDYMKAMMQKYVQYNCCLDVKVNVIGIDVLKPGGWC